MVTKSACQPIHVNSCPDYPPTKPKTLITWTPSCQAPTFSTPPPPPPKAASKPKQPHPLALPLQVLKMCHPSSPPPPRSKLPPQKSSPLSTSRVGGKVPSPCRRTNSIAGNRSAYLASTTTISAAIVDNLAGNDDSLSSMHLPLKAKMNHNYTMAVRIHMPVFWIPEWTIVF
jgi:hypothetical protein